MSVAKESKTAEKDSTVHLLPTPIKGKADWRQYRAFRLPNGVTCLAVHDKESKTTGMSCLVNVGAAADPRELSGLAHFCEHMCFLGSEKYPGENEYKRFLSNHGGHSNASTSMHCTNYKAEVLADHAETAFDIFSNFFVAPLFSLSGTSREVNAIDSENSKNLTADVRRRLQILKDLADPNHYYSKFSTGNAGTLDTQDPSKLEWIREALLAFHRKHYRPDNMTVVLAGPQSLDTLQEWIVARYSLIPTPSVKKSSDELSPVERLIEEAAAEAPPNSLDQPPLPFRSAFLPAMQGGTWPVLLTTKPLKSMRKLVLLWPIPSPDKRNPDQSPSSFISHLLGHEGAGSVFAVLQNHGMLSSLSAGPRTSAPDFTLFQVDMALTEKGEQNWKEVVNGVFAYCRLLQDKVAKAQNGDVTTLNELKQIWDEMSRLDQMFFHQTSPGGVYNYAPNLADRINSYGTERALSAGSMLDENGETFPLEKVAEMVQLFRPSNCIVERCSESAWDEATAAENGVATGDGFGKKKEKWYGIEYHLSKIEKDDTVSWEGIKPMASEVAASELSLPRPNRYIPRNLELCPELPEEAKQGPRIEKPIDPPSLLVDDDTGRLFHRLDDRYALPHASLTLLIRNAAVQNVKETDHWEYNDEAALFSSMLSGAFSEAMAQETYDAELAGLNWNLSLGPYGIKLSFFGFSDRLPDLALTILDAFLSGEFIQAAYFESTKDRVIRGLKTYFESRRADSHAVYYRDALLASKDRGIDASLSLAEKSTLDGVRGHFRAVLGNPEIRMECLFSGNVSAQAARTFYQAASSKIQKAQTLNPTETRHEAPIPAGMVELRVNPGEDIELHFASKNPEEENGAVVCSYQSSVPSYKGENLSHPEWLQSTAAIRLISHMLREPLFNDLRTKQQLGYVVTAYYELGYSSRPNDELASLGPLTTPVDFITVAILSRKLPPPDIVQRIDEFMTTFRESLETMLDSEIKDHADSLSTKLLKPIQKLQTEASDHFAKIQRYVPEIAHRLEQKNKSANDLAAQLPWSSVEPLAAAIRSLTRRDLLETWDRMTHPSRRSRIVSCVYGNTFPLAAAGLAETSSIQPRPVSSAWNSPQRIKVVNSFSDILQLRKKLVVFDDRVNQQRRTFSTWIARAPSQPVWAKVGFGCMVGAGMVGLALAFRNQRRPMARR